MKDILRGLEMVDSVSDRGSPHSILEILAENPVDVIMIDQNPGGGNVFDIVKVIRSKSVGAHTNFVLMAESLDDALRQEGSAAGIRGFLGKPYDIRGIEAALVAAAGLDRQPEAAAPAGDAAKGGSDRLRDTLDKLRRVSLFSGFSDPELIRLLKICRTRNYPAGSFIFHEGEKGYSLYVLVAGTLEIRKEEHGTSRVLVEMHPGDCFGEMAIIADEPRMADATAATDCTVIEVNASVVNSNEDIISLKLVRQIAILLAKKLRLRG
jgi:CheY-like chemotaxis protein